MTDLHAVSSVRSEGDSLDITESVGATALSVAAARAVETATADPLIRDPFAYVLVSSAGQPWARLATDLEWIGDDDHGRRAHRLVLRLPSGAHALLRLVFRRGRRRRNPAGGDPCLGAHASRAFRLDWPAGTTVYEIDQPQVVTYKTTTLESAGAAPTADRRTVPVDLRDDWAGRVGSCGFRPRPTDRLAGRGSAAVPTGRGSGPAVRDADGVECAGQPGGRRSVQPRRQPTTSDAAPRGGRVSSGCVNALAWTSTSKL